MANRPVSYKIHLQPLFTDEQQTCMQAGPTGFDLKKYEDVRDRAARIYGRLSDKTMPADDSGPWPDEWIGLFKRWMDEGLAP
jgi:hypothetical protein